MLACAMKTQVLVQRSALFCILVLGFAAAFAACGDDKETKPSGQGGSAGAPGTGGAGGMGGMASGSGGMGGMGIPDAGNAPFGAECSGLCGYLVSIGCQAWPNCQSECGNGFNAPAACHDEFKAMVDCWVANQQAFSCTMTQIVPPPACQVQEQAFNDCFTGTPPEMDAGMMGCMPQQGVCSKNADSCSCKTNCAGTDLKWACSLLADMQTWSCSCYSTPQGMADQLLGTCTQNFEGCLGNAMGCCEPFFVQ